MKFLINKGIFLFAHKPPYNSNANYGSFMSVRAALEPLFSKYSVDLGIFGHEVTMVTRYISFYAAFV